VAASAGPRPGWSRRAQYSLFFSFLAVIAGLIVGHDAPRMSTGASRLQTSAVWRLVDFLLEGLVFLLIGQQLPRVIGELSSYSPGTIAAAVPEPATFGMMGLGLAGLAAFARRRRVGVSVLCGRGAVAAVTLRLAAAAASAVTLHGRFEVLALSGTVLPSSSSFAPAFSVSLAGVGGQVIGGTLAGEMTAADGVVVVAAVFRTAEVHRLPAAGAEDGDGDGDGGGGREDWRHPHSQQQLQVAAAASAGDGHVGQHAEQLAEIGLWGQQPTPTREPVHHPLHRF